MHKPKFINAQFLSKLLLNCLDIEELVETVLDLLVLMKFVLNDVLHYLEDSVTQPLVLRLLLVVYIIELFLPLLHRGFEFFNHFRHLFLQVFNVLIILNYFLVESEFVEFLAERFIELLHGGQHQIVVRLVFQNRILPLYNLRVGLVFELVYHLYAHALT